VVRVAAAGAAMPYCRALEVVTPGKAGVHTRLRVDVRDLTRSLRCSSRRSDTLASEGSCDSRLRAFGASAPPTPPGFGWVVAICEARFDVGCGDLTRSLRKVRVVRGFRVFGPSGPPTPPGFGWVVASCEARFDAASGDLTRSLRLFPSRSPAPAWRDPFREAKGRDGEGCFVSEANSPFRPFLLGYFFLTMGVLPIAPSGPPSAFAPLLRRSGPAKKK
jgi:hypothetical protein